MNAKQKLEMYEAALHWRTADALSELLPCKECGRIPEFINSPLGDPYVEELTYLECHCNLSLTIKDLLTEAWNKRAEGGVDG